MHIVSHRTLSAMTSKIKMAAISGGTLYREPMERLAFQYHWHKIFQVRHIYNQLMLMRIFCLTLAGFIILDAIKHNLILYTLHKRFILIYWGEP